jgi:hypothetical protein
MLLPLVRVDVNRRAHPNKVFAMLQNEAGESVNVQIRFEASTNVESLTLREIATRAREELKDSMPHEKTAQDDLAVCSDTTSQRCSCRRKERGTIGSLVLCHARRVCRLRVSPDV